MTKLQKLTAILFLECVRSPRLSIQKYNHGSFSIYFWDESDIIKSWQTGSTYDEDEIKKIIISIRRFVKAFGAV